YLLLGKAKLETEDSPIIRRIKGSYNKLLLRIEKQYKMTIASAIAYIDLVLGTLP
ncbi:MAG: hypothetical protein RIR20_295, partial [Pseudomonadota bacterium]